MKIRDPEAKPLLDRISSFAGNADAEPVVEDLLAYSELEMMEAMDCSAPSAPGNGRAIDSFHASCCIMRAWWAVRIIKRAMKENV